MPRRMSQANLRRRRRCSGAHRSHEADGRRRAAPVAL